MKKHNKKTSILFVTISILITGFLFSACDGVIFDEIRKEVKLADAKIAGDIQNIIRFKYDNEECVFVTNGKIRYRSVEDDVVDNKGVGFSDFSSPSGYVYSIAAGTSAGTSNLYAMSATIEEDDDGYNAVTKRTLYCYDSGSWKQIWSEAYSTKRAFIICTNTKDQTKREAYFVYGSSVYELSGSSTTIDTSDTNSMKCVYAEGNFPIGELANADNSRTPLAVNSCTSLGGTVYFSSAYAMTSATTSTSGETAYYSDGAYVYYSTNGSNWVPVNLGCDTILSLTITNNYLLAGTSDGIVHTPINENAVPSSGTADFSTNADSALSSYYEIPALLAIDPIKNETDGTIYASSITSSSSASLNNVGLWSYYASTGEWNRE